LERERLQVDPAFSRQLAHEFAAPPALAVNAVRAAKLAGGKDKDLRLALRSVTKAMAGGVDLPPLPKPDAAFSLDLANADQRLDVLAERLSQFGFERAVSLCLFGPPGTGKSAFARHLAERMDMPVLHKRASDLISKWLGESEANIAAAFADARAEGAFLIFDEADSLLTDRAVAQRSWEISQVNEMLTWMESHELPFACTTNLMDRLDNASLRRFTFKIRFDFLDRDQVRRAFTRFFGLTAPSRVNGMDLLTPGDFAVVRRRASLLGFNADADALADALAQEMTAKPQASKPIGFQMGNS
jgi:SpoVK/Ycf46/Vps4 family AAA+-type ATPase